MAKTALIAVLLALLGTGCIARKLNDQGLRPSSEFRMMPADLDLICETFAVPVDGAEIHCWFLLAASPSRRSVLVCGGNNGNKQLYLPLAQELSRHGLNTVLVDYRGFGFSTGEPDLWSIVPDVLAVVRTVAERPDTEELAVFGMSLGSVAAVGLAREAPSSVRALVLEGSFSPRDKLDEMAGSFIGTIGAPFLIPSVWEVKGILAAYPHPILFLHGEPDWITDIEGAQRIFAEALKAEAPRSFWISSAGHTPGFAGRFGPGFVAHITDFLDRAFSDPAPLPRFDHLEGRTPIETLTFRENEPPLRARSFFDPAAPRPVEADAVTVPVIPVAETEDGGWEWDDAYFRDRVVWEGIDRAVYKRIGLGLMYRMKGKRGYLQIGEPPEEAEVRSGCAEMEAKLTETLSGEVHPLIRPLYSDAWHALGSQYERLGENEKALAAFERYLSLVPENPHGRFWFGNGNWEFGMDLGVVAGTLRRMAKLAPDEATREALLARSRGFEQSAADRAALMKEWKTEQRAVLGTAGNP